MFASNCSVWFDRKWIPWKQDVETGMRGWKWSGKVIKEGISVNEGERPQLLFRYAVQYVRVCVVSLYAGGVNDGWRVKERMRQMWAVRVRVSVIGESPYIFCVIYPSSGLITKAWNVWLSFSGKKHSFCWQRSFCQWILGVLRVCVSVSLSFFVHLRFPMFPL